MKIYLLSWDNEMVTAWERHFHNEQDVHVVKNEFARFMHEYDVKCVVSPANSFGLEVARRRAGSGTCDGGADRCDDLRRDDGSVYPGLGGASDRVPAFAYPVVLAGDRRAGPCQ